MIQDLTINIRTKSDVRDLIDTAASILGKNRSEFMLETALREAQDVIKDRAFIALNSKDFDALTSLLESPPPPNEALISLVNKPSIWKK